jgi:diguanylate cyclase (GGDEF)-like protein/PAS domain S-box-containing protein
MRRPLKFYVVAALAAIMVPFLLLHAYFVQRHVDHDRELLVHKLYENARLSAAEVEHFLFLAQASLSKLARLDDFSAMASGQACDPRLPNYLAANPNFEAISVTDGSGEVRCSTSEHRGFPGRIALASRAIARNAFAVSDPARDAANSWRVWLAYPIDAGNRGVGAIVAVVDLAYFDSAHLRNALQQADLDPGSTVTLFNAKGTVVARWPDGERWIGTNVLRSEIGKIVLSGTGERFPAATGLDGVKRIYTYTRLNASDWYLLAGVPHETLTAAGSQFRLNDAGLSAGVVLLMLAMAYFLVRRVTGQIATAAASARAAAQGDMSVRVPVRGPRELAEMAEQFNSLLVSRARAEMELARKQDDLRHERNRAMVTLGSIADAVIATDPMKRITYLNPSAERLTGWHNDDARGMELHDVVDLIDDEDRELMEIMISMMMRDCREPHRLENAYLRRRDGQKLAVADSMACIRTSDDACEGAVLVMRDVTKERETARLLSWQANHDQLTGLLNRSAFEDALRAAAKRVRHEGEKCSLLYLDLDRFKVVNDASGHRAGDRLLCLLTEVMHEKLRDTDTLARIGGDEFAVLLENCALDRALKVAETLRELVGDFKFCWEDKCFTIGVSIGALALTDEDRDVELILAEADAACYRAKERGRNRVHLFQPSDFDVNRRMADMDWARRATAGFSDGNMRLYGQTIAPLNGSGEERCEVLLRLADDGEILVPDAFLPSIERYGMMPMVDRWVIRTLFAGIRDELYNAQADTYFVNLSGHSLSEDGFLDFILHQFEATRISPDRICFEVTETTAVVNFPQAREFIGKLTRYGCHFALDDFGSGMASFSYLRNLPADTLKIDGNFVLGMGKEPINRAVVEAINDIGHTLKMATIAESVENSEILRQVTEIGVDYIQGFGVEIPIPLEEWRKTA